MTRQQRLNTMQREQMLLDARAYMNTRYAEMWANWNGAPMTDEGRRLHELGMWERVSRQIERRFK